MNVHILHPHIYLSMYFIIIHFVSLFISFICTSIREMLCPSSKLELWAPCLGSKLMYNLSPLVFLVIVRTLWKILLRWALTKLVPMGFFSRMFTPSWGNFEHDHKVIMIHEARYKPANVVWVFDFSIDMFTLKGVSMVWMFQN